MFTLFLEKSHTKRKNIVRPISDFYTSTSNMKIPLTALTPPPGGGGGVLFAECSVDPLHGLCKAILGKDEVSQVPLHTLGHKEAL